MRRIFRLFKVLIICIIFFSFSFFLRSDAFAQGGGGYEPPTFADPPPGGWGGGQYSDDPGAPGYVEICGNGMGWVPGGPPPVDAGYADGAYDGGYDASYGGGTPTPTPTGSVTPTPSASPTPTPTSPPTPTPTKTPKVCNETCEVVADCAAGLTCIDVSEGRRCRLPSNPDSPTCSAKPTPTPTATLTPTPTLPPFSQDMCKCDSIELSPKEFGAGSKLTVTAYAKVEGSDVSYAEVDKMLFSSGKGVDPNIKRDVPYEVPVAVQLIENTPTKKRYKATWSYTVPAKLDPKLTYRIWADPVCVRKGEAGKISSSSQEIEVIPQSSSSTTSQNAGFFGNIWNFFRGLFGSSSNNNSSTTQTIQSQEEEVNTTAGEDTLQLGIIGFGEITETDKCRFIKFRAKR